MVHQCDLYDKVYASASALRNHKSSASDAGPDHFSPKCGKTFARSDKLRRHIQTVHGQREQCRIFGHIVHRKDNLARHIRSQHPEIMRVATTIGRRVNVELSRPVTHQNHHNLRPEPPQEPQTSLQDPPRVPGSSERDLIEDDRVRSKLRNFVSKSTPHSGFREARKTFTCVQ